MKNKLYVAILVCSAHTTAHAGFGDYVNKTVGDIKTGVTSLGQKPQPVPTPTPTTEQSAVVGSPVDELANKDISSSKRVGQIAGGIAGIVAGNALCNQNKKCKENDLIRTAAVGVGAAGGAWGGGAIGEMCGKIAADRRRKYVKESDFLDSEIASSEKARTVREAEIKENQAEIERDRKRIAELESSKSLTQSQIKELGDVKARLEKREADNKRTIEQYDDTLAYLDSVLSSSKQSADEKHDEKGQWEKKYADLQAKRNTLLAQKTELEQQNTALAGDQQLVDKVLSNGKNA